MYGDNVIEKHGINRDRTGDREKTRYLCGKQGIFTRDRALIRPGFIRQLETRASTRSASFFHALGSPGRPHNGGGAAGAYRTRNGAKPLKQGHLRAKRGPLGPSRKSQQQTKRTGFAALEDTARARRYRTTARSGRPTLTATCGSLGSTGGRSTSSPQRPVKPPRSPQETRTESRESNFTRRAKRQREGRQKPPLSESKKPALLRGSPRRFWGG